MKSNEIYVLPEEIINKIAAGEVIERPASVVKELIENAIDAQATRIQVQIEDAGKKKILVADNGKGMSSADLDLCYLRHTTSKLRTAEDLFHLHTNGFRGEAVASIAAISKMTITSANDLGDSYRVVLNAGNCVQKEEFAANRGTSFLVEDLFFNTPVRRSFLSSDTSETTRILEVITKCALSHPEIRFDYKVNDKTVFIGVPGDLKSRIAETIGSGIVKKMLPVEYSEAGIQVSGFVSSPSETKGKRNNHYLFLRSRPIENKAIAKAISQTYEPYGVSAKPVTVLFIDMPDTEFDVNVHPAKREVRFANQQLVFLAVSRALREAFKKEIEANSPFINLAEVVQNTPAFPNYEYLSENNRTFTPSKKAKKEQRVADIDEVQDLFSQPEAGIVISLEDEHKKLLNTPKIDDTWTPPTLFQIAKTYIAAEDGEGILIIDQHAAHTRILYEQALETLSHGSAIDSQELLFPELIDLTKMEREILKSVAKDLQKLGFFIEPFGGETFQIRSIPSGLSLSRAGNAVHEFLELYENENASPEQMLEFSAKAWAKTNAFRAGDKLKPEEMSSLINQLMVTEDPLKSPYGAPTLLRITLDELDKKFRR